MLRTVNPTIISNRFSKHRHEKTDLERIVAHHGCDDWETNYGHCAAYNPASVHLVSFPPSRLSWVDLLEVDTPEPAVLSRAHIDQEQPEAKFLQVGHNLQRPRHAERDIDRSQPRPLRVRPELVRPGHDPHRWDRYISLLIFYYSLKPSSAFGWGDGERVDRDAPLLYCITLIMVRCIGTSTV